MDKININEPNYRPDITNDWLDKVSEGIKRWLLKSPYVIDDYFNQCDYQNILLWANEIAYRMDGENWIREKLDEGIWMGVCLMAMDKILKERNLFNHLQIIYTPDYELKTETVGFVVKNPLCKLIEGF